MSSGIFIKLPKIENEALGYEAATTEEIESELIATVKGSKIMDPENEMLNAMQKTRIRYLSAIQSLYLRGEKEGITDECLKFLPKIRSIDLCANKNITDEGLSYLSKIELKAVYLALCYSITGEGLRNVRYVERLSLAWLGKDVFSGLKYLQCIQMIEVSSSKIEDSDLAYLSGVKTIMLSYCSHISDDGMKHLSKVKNINISNCPQITIKGLRYLENVKNIDISRCYYPKNKHRTKRYEKKGTTPNNITDECMALFEEIQSINISGCSKVTDEGLRCLKKVKRIALWGLKGPRTTKSGVFKPGITKDGFDAIRNGLKCAYLDNEQKERFEYPPKEPQKSDKKENSSLITVKELYDGVTVRLTVV